MRPPRRLSVTGHARPLEVSTTQTSGGRRGLAFYDLGADRFEWVEEPAQDVDDVSLSDDGRVLAWLVNDQGYDRLRVRDLASGRDLPTPELPAGARPHLTGDEPPLAVSGDGSHVALIVSSPRRPP